MNSKNGKLQGIAIRRAKRASMQKLVSADVSLARGVENDFRGKAGKRQVTVISKEAWEEVNADIGQQLPWTTRRANLLISGIELENTTGYSLAIGPDLVLQITGETEPCWRMDELHSGLQNALKNHWRGGVTCVVISEGNIKEDDEVRLSSAE